jgi:hypothetical protein
MRFDLKICQLSLKTVRESDLEIASKSHRSMVRRINGMVRIAPKKILPLVRNCIKMRLESSFINIKIEEKNAIRVKT